MTHILDREVPDIARHNPDLIATGEPPVQSGSPRGFRKWRNRAIVVLMIAGAAFGSLELVHQHSADSFKLALDNIVLTSQPIDVNIAQTGVVTQVAVQAGDRVVAGERVGSVDVTTTNAKGRALIVHRTLRAPSNGIVVTDPVSVGATLLPGSSFLEMYNPNDLQLVTTVPLSYLPKISPGMSADLTAAGVPGTVKATLERAVPRVGSAQTDVPKGSVQLVFVPRHRATIAKLIPGLHFHGYVDTRTGHGHTGDAQYVGAS